MMQQPQITMRSIPEKCLGILFFTVDYDEIKNHSYFLEVSIDDLNKSVFSLNKKSTTFGIHLHLLEKGSHNIKFSVMTNKEKEISHSDFVIELGNENDLHKEVRRSLISNKTPLIFEGLCDSSYYPYEDTEIAPWFDRPDAPEYIKRLLVSKEITFEEAESLSGFVKDGLLILENLIDEDLLKAVNSDIDDCILKGYQNYEYGSSQRIEHLHLHYESVRKLWLDNRHRRFVDLIFGVASRPCQTLTYVFGSQQEEHQDLIHLTPFPAGYMCGTWIALQDIQDNSGELVVYPGSHRTNRIYLRNTGIDKVGSDWKPFAEKVVPLWRDICKDYPPLKYKPKKGTVLIWHENLIHAGSLRLDNSLERRSFVIHSFAEGSLAYYDTSGLPAIVASRSELTNEESTSIMIRSPYSFLAWGLKKITDVIRSK